MSAGMFDDIKNTSLVMGGFLIPQDKASMYGPQQLVKSLIKGGDVIDARAGCGTCSLFCIGPGIKKLARHQKCLHFSFASRHHLKGVCN